jgi:transposase-like protein
MCNDKNENIIKKTGVEMKRTGKPYYLRDILYQKYECPSCRRTKVKVLNGFSKGGRVKI